MRYILIILVFLSVGARAQMVIKAHPNYVPFASVNLLLDDYPNAAAAYSLRKLDKDYTGAAIRVRKDTTGQPEQDIGFTAAGDLDTASLKSFLNARSGFVVTCYDQSSNARNATQATQVNQPRIANLGVIDRLNNKVTMFFDGSTDHLIRDDLSNLVSGEDKPMSLLSVISKTNTTTSGNIFGFGGNITPYIFIGLISTNNDYGFEMRDNANATSTFTAGNYSANTQYLISFFTTGLAFEYFSNNASQISNTYNRGTLTLTRAAIGVLRRENIALTSFFGGNIQEVIFYDTDKKSDRTGMQNNINAFYSIY